ncbi:MAG: large conductance mechanosensitive channel protein MscL [Lachnospiraceae bacterium]|nr:large conductance mechanosensitive channel protein MscL [Lachnospiraceae bacterium]
MKLFKEFKEFLNRGNVVDLAVGVVIGAAFKAIVDSFVGDIISPLIGSIFNMDFTELTVTINGAELRYGAFIMAIINFIIIAFVIFLFVKGVNKMREAAAKKKAAEEEAAPTTKICPFCKSEIPIDATKCKFCASEVPEEKAEE